MDSNDWRWLATLLGAVGGAIVGAVSLWEVLKPKLPPPPPSPREEEVQGVRWNRQTGEPSMGTININGGGRGN